MFSSTPTFHNINIFLQIHKGINLLAHLCFITSTQGSVAFWDKTYIEYFFTNACFISWNETVLFLWDCHITFKMNFWMNNIVGTSSSSLIWSDIIGSVQFDQQFITSIIHPYSPLSKKRDVSNNLLVAWLTFFLSIFMWVLFCWSNYKFFFKKWTA